MITEDGLYISDKLTDKELWDLLCGNITLDDLKNIKIYEARNKARKDFNEIYLKKYTEILSPLTGSVLQKLRYATISQYMLTQSQYMLTQDKNIITLDEDRVNNRKKVTPLEHRCSTNMYFLVISRLLEEKRPRGKEYRKKMARINRGQNKSKNR